MGRRDPAAQRPPTALTASCTPCASSPGEAGSIGLVSVADDFFVAVRVFGEEERILLSDVTAAQDWPIAREVLERLELPMPDDDDLEQVQPAGDLGVFADMGVPAMDVAMLCEDLDLYPDEISARSRRGWASARSSSRPSTRRPRLSRRRTTGPCAWRSPRRARTGATDDVPVGAVVLDPAGEVVGRGHNAREAPRDPTAHAEVRRPPRGRGRRRRLAARPAARSS